MSRTWHILKREYLENVRTKAFLIGLAAAWAAVRAWRRPTALFTGISIWPLAVLIGMVARRLVFDRGTATSFVVIATVFLGVFLVGWRAVLRQIELRRSHRTSVHPC